jgi:hypothetical protein
MLGLGDGLAQVPGAIGRIAIPLTGAVVAVVGRELPGVACVVSAARNRSATAGSAFSVPAALVSSSSVMIPVCGSAAICAR